MRHHSGDQHKWHWIRLKVVICTVIIRFGIAFGPLIWTQISAILQKSNEKPSKNDVRAYFHHSFLLPRVYKLIPQYHGIPASDPGWNKWSYERPHRFQVPALDIWISRRVHFCLCASDVSPFISLSLQILIGKSQCLNHDVDNVSVGSAPRKSRHHPTRNPRSYSPRLCPNTYVRAQYANPQKGFLHGLIHPGSAPDEEWRRKPSTDGTQGCPIRRLYRSQRYVNIPSLHLQTPKVWVRFSCITTGITIPLVPTL